MLVEGKPIHWSDDKNQMPVAESLFSYPFVSSLLSQEMDLSTSITGDQKKSD